MYVTKVALFRKKTKTKTNQPMSIHLLENLSQANNKNKRERNLLKGRQPKILGKFYLEIRIGFCKRT